MKHISNKNSDKRGKKDWRKPYKKSEVFDRSCRHGGSCDWCESDRLHRKESQELNQEDQVEDYEDKKE